MKLAILRAAVILCLIQLPGTTGWAAAPADAGSHPRFVRIGHYQCECRQGDFDANVKKVLEGLQLAADARLDIVSFPESLLTGYFRNEADAREHCFSIDSPQMKLVLDRTAKFPMLFMVGFNELRGEDLYNTVAVIERGRLLGRYSKAMPIHPYFKPGRDFPVFEKKGLKFGIVICADGGYIEPTRILAIKGARLVFAPHFNFVSGPIKHYQMVRNDHIARAVENGVYFLRGNNVVSQHTLTGLRELGYGYGDSYLLNPNGDRVAGAGLYHETLMIYNLDLAKTHRAQPNRRSMKSARELLPILQKAMQEAGGGRSR